MSDSLSGNTGYEGDYNMDGPVDVENPIDPFTLLRVTPRESTTISMRDLLKERLPQESSSRREPSVPQGCKQGIIFAVYTDV